jgi:hypothetical protein
LKGFTEQIKKGWHDVISSQLEKNFRLEIYFGMEHLTLTSFSLVRALFDLFGIVLANF